MSEGGNRRIFSDVQVSVDGAIGSLVLDRPERLNALTYETLRQLADAARWFDGQDGVKVVIVRGEGRLFCAGFDTRALGSGDAGSVPGGAGSARDNAELGRLMADAVGAMRAVTIAEVHGRAVGGGMVLMMACDLRAISDDTLLSLPEMDLGIPLTWGAVPRLVREIGPSATKDLVLTCREVDADEALRLGLVNAVTAPDALRATVEDMAATIARKSRLTIDQTLAQIEAVADQLVTTTGSATDADLLVAALADAESRAVGRAFVEQRAAARRARP